MCTDHTGAVTFSPLEEQLITVAHLSSHFIRFYLPVGHLLVGRKGKSQPAVSLQRYITPEFKGHDKEAPEDSIRSQM